MLSLILFQSSHYFNNARSLSLSSPCFFLSQCRRYIFDTIVAVNEGEEEGITKKKLGSRIDFRQIEERERKFFWYRQLKSVLYGSGPLFPGGSRGNRSLSFPFAISISASCLLAGFFVALLVF